MRLTPDLQKKSAAVAAFVLLAGGILYYQLADDSPAPKPVSSPASSPLSSPVPSGVNATSPQRGSSARTGPAAKNIGTTSAQLDPTLRMGPMLMTEQLVYSGTGRNIFSAASAPVEIPKALAPARPKGSAAQVYTPPPGPPPPPPIDLKFFGTATSTQGKRRALLLHGEDVFLASDGDIVQRRYRVITVSASSILVEDMTNNNQQSLPLIAR